MDLALHVAQSQIRFFSPLKEKIRYGHLDTYFSSQISMW